MAKDNARAAHKVLKRLRRMLEDAEVGMLTTVAADGTLRSRPMAAREVELFGEVWFLTRAGSPKAGEIRDNQQVSLTFTDPREDLYVSMSGRASIVRDPERVRDLWKRGDKSWFPEGKNDPDLALLRVQVEHAEYWDEDACAMRPVPRPEPEAAAGAKKASAPTIPPA